MGAPLKKSMSPEKQRIAIAEELPDLLMIINRRQGDVAIRNGVISFVKCDPLNDLDVMHEIEITLDCDGKNRFINNLENVVSSNSTAYLFPWALIHSVAAQRAEAFLKTIGKWEEE